MDRFRLDDPDAAEKAALVWHAMKGPKTLIELMQGLLDAIEQPRLPTRSEVKANERLRRWCALADVLTTEVAQIMVEEGWATEDHGPAAEDEYPERAPGFVLGYYEGWADAKAGRQYGEGQHGQRSGLVDAEEPIVMVSEDPEPEVDPAHVEALTRLLMDAALATFGHQAAAAWLLASGRVQVTPQ